MPLSHSTMGAEALEDAVGLRRVIASAGQFVALTKPRVMSLAVFTAFVGLWIAPRHLDFAGTSLALICIALGAAAAGALNMWYDADIDAVMRRTASRPIPRGQRSPREALTFGLVLGIAATVVCAVTVNVTAAALLAFTIAYYAIVYTAWLKRRSPESIVIGGAAGALPPVIGWAATGSAFSSEPLLLFLITFLWTPPHFWALALERSADYARAGVPALPVVAGREETKRRILRYSLLLVVSSALPWALGYAGAVYAAAAALLGIAFLGLAIKVRTSVEGPQARQLFAFSIFYLFALFASLPVDQAVRSERVASAEVETAVALNTVSR
jgi:heme o synthase